MTGHQSSNIGFFLLDGAAFALFIGAVVTLGAWEWARLAGLAAQAQRVGYAALVALLLVHAGAAMFHHYVIKDDTLKRMTGKMP